MIPVDPVVHVGGPGRECVPGIVIVAADVSRIRVIRPTPYGGKVGTDDEEGDVRHWSDPRWVPLPHDAPAYDVHPEGSFYRLLDSWHSPDMCSLVVYPVMSS